MPTVTPSSSTSTPRSWRFQADDQPVISVDTKKKELVGNYTNKGTEYRPEGQPRRIEVHDFENKELGKVVPYGVYDLADNSGWVSVGVTQRHRRVRRQRHPLLVRQDGPRPLSRGRPADDHGRLRRLQRSPRAAVEARTSERWPTRPG